MLCAAAVLESFYTSLTYMLEDLLMARKYGGWRGAFAKLHLVLTLC